MRVTINTSLLIAGFRKPLPEGAIVTVVDEVEAEQLIVRGYLSKTTKDATHDDLSAKAEDEAAAKAAAEAKKATEAVAAVDADADGKRQEAAAGDGKVEATTAPTKKK